MPDGFGSIIGSIGGSTPYGAIAQGVIGGVQAIAGGIQAHRANKKLEKMVNSYQPNASIMDYYNKALQRYNVNPYQSALYRNATQGAGRGLASGIAAMHNLRSNNIGGLVQQYNDAQLKAAAAAESQQGAALGQLGQATGMKAQEDFKPFEMKYNLQAMKAAGGAQVANAGISNLFGGAQNFGNAQMINSMYGDQSQSYGGGMRGAYSPMSADVRRPSLRPYGG